MRYPHLSAMLRAARERLGIPQAEAAARSEIPATTYASYEQGRSRPRPETALHLAGVLGLSYSEIMCSDVPEVGTCTRWDGCGRESEPDAVA